MTLKEIEALKLIDAIGIILRWILDVELLPEGEELYWISETGTSQYDRLKVNKVYKKPKLKELNAQFGMYKEKLKDIENARLANIARIEDLKSRWAALKFGATAFAIVNPGVPNRALWIKNALQNTNHAAIEAKMVALEDEDQSIIEHQEEIDKEKEDRRKDIAQLKKGLDAIESSDLPTWHKRILRRLVLELKE